MDFVQETLRDMLEPRRGQARNGVTVAYVADHLGMPESTLYAYMRDRRIPVVMVPDVTNVTQDMRLIQALCQRCAVPAGGTFVVNPIGRSSDDALLDTVRDTSAAIASVARRDPTTKMNSRVAHAIQSLCDLRLVLNSPNGPTKHATTLREMVGE